MTYLSRPVLETEIDWQNPVNKRFSYDLRELALGFGAEVFTSLQIDTVQGYDLQFDLTTDAAIAAFDEFFDALQGRLTGFWLPEPMERCQIVASVSPTVFNITDQNLRDAWDEHSGVYLFFIREGYTSAAAKVLSVTSIGGGLEQVTLDAAVNINLLHASAFVHRLLYVRLASDEEDGTFMAEGWLRANLRVVELPREYAAIETGITRIWLYDFYAAEPINLHWRYTSFAADVRADNKLYTAAAITHGSIRETLRAESQTVKVECAYDAAHPLALFLPFPPSVKVSLTIRETSFADPTDDLTTRFVGRVGAVQDDGEKLVAEVESFGSIFKRQGLRMMIQPDCNHHLFDVNCGVKRTNYELNTAIVAVSGQSAYPPILQITTPGSPVADNYYAGGLLEYGTGADYQVRTILKNETLSGLLYLTLNLPLIGAVNGESIRVVKGCDGKIGTCQSVYNNLANFGGFPAVPQRNPALEALDLPVSQGGKK